MIIILTGGNQSSRELIKNNILNEIPQDLEIEIFEVQPYNELRSKIELSILTSKHKLIIGCFMKSQRYEIYCLARRFDIQYLIVADSADCEHDYYEEPQTIHKCEKNMVMSYQIDKIIEIICSSDIKLCGFGSNANWAHKKRDSPSSNYLNNIKELIEKVNKCYSDYSYVFKICQERMYNIININPIEFNSIEKTYKKIIEDEIKRTNI